MRLAGSRRGPAGFTLTELVISIGLILLLAGLALSVSVAVIEQSERRQTQTVLALLDTAVKEWELTAERTLSWWNGKSDGDREAADVHFDTAEVLIITEILKVISRSEQVKRIIAGIDPDLVHTYTAGTLPPWIDASLQYQIYDFNGNLTVLDPWGTPIYATHPGRIWTPGDCGPDPDGTNQTVNEKRYGVAPNRRVVFVSAGPDQRFGLSEEFNLLNADDRKAAIAKARADNIYSVDVGFPGQ